MNVTDVIRAWKDPEYRESLSDEQQAALPANPAGLIELSDKSLGVVVGASGEDSCRLPACGNTHGGFICNSG